MSLQLIIFTCDVSVFIQLVINIQRGWIFWRRICGVVKLLYFFFPSLWARPILKAMVNEQWYIIADYITVIFCWYISKWWGLKKDDYLNRCQNLFLQLNPYYLRGYIHVFPWDQWAILRCKNGKWSFWPNTKNTGHKTGTRFKM